MPAEEQLGWVLGGHGRWLGQGSVLNSPGLRAHSLIEGWALTPSCESGVEALVAGF